MRLHHAHIMPSLCPQLQNAHPPKHHHLATTSFTTPAARWRATISRAPAAHAAFVYAVLTTRIYCRPTCAARLARRANVAFYDDSASAAAAGFRACKRCRPDESDGDAFDERERGRRAAARARGVLERERGAVVWREVAGEVGLSTRYLHDAFKKAFGVTPGAYARALKRGGGAERDGRSLEEEAAVRGGEVGERNAPEDEGSELAGLEAWLDFPPEEAFAVENADCPALDASLSSSTDGSEWDSWDEFLLWEPVTFPLENPLPQGVI